MPFIELQSVDSTNNYARSLIASGTAVHGTGIFAHEQTAGRGQRSKTWISEPGSSIILSLLVQGESFSAAQQFGISACAAVTAARLLNKYAKDGAAIKWPNDLYWQDRKAGGILVENIIRGQNLEWSIVGIGINLNQAKFPSSLPNPVSLRQITGREWNARDMARELYEEFFENHSLMAQGEPHHFHETYLELLFKRNRMHRFRSGSRVFEAMVHDVSPEGLLVLRHGIDESFAHGEIEWL